MNAGAQELIILLLLVGGIFTVWALFRSVTGAAKNAAGSRPTPPPPSGDRPTPPPPTGRPLGGLAEMTTIPCQRCGGPYNFEGDFSFMCHRCGDHRGFREVLPRMLSDWIESGMPPMSAAESEDMLDRASTDMPYSYECYRMFGFMAAQTAGISIVGRTTMPDKVAQLVALCNTFALVAIDHLGLRDHSVQFQDDSSPFMIHPQSEYGLQIVHSLKQRSAKERPATPDLRQNPPPTVPAGWHADPLGSHELRYWDGANWTEHVSNGNGQSADPT